MPKALVLGNGSLLVGLDQRGQVRDFYFPHVGLENHSGGDCVHRIGIFVDGQFSWLSDSTWVVSIQYRTETLASNIRALNRTLAIELEFLDIVYNEKNIFVRRVCVKNLTERARNAKIFFHQQFQINATPRGDSAYFDPDHNIIIHYKGPRVFVVGGVSGEQVFDDYSIGIFDIEGKEGTWRDAEDGVLEKNPVEHGSVDSVIAFTVQLQSLEEKRIHYWISAAESLKEGHTLHRYIVDKKPDHLIKSTQDYWHAWVNKLDFTFYGLDASIVDLFKKSLLIIRTHVDNQGGIIASGDSDMLQYGRDTYAYVWMRDASFITLALDKAGYGDITRKFFEFANDVLADRGYFYHKYRSDRALGSSWHPWIMDGKRQLAIQEDETALVLYALWEHYRIRRDLEFIELIYNSFIKKSAEFLLAYRDPATGLPLESYDLWEEKYGTATFTASTVYAGLMAASSFARLLGKEEDEARYHEPAVALRIAILHHLYNEKSGYFVKRVRNHHGTSVVDDTIDASSLLGIFRFGILDIADERLKKAFEIFKRELSCETPIGGIVRYSNDKYYRVSNTTPGNPWFITTLWYAQYLIATAVTESDLAPAKEWLNWVAKHATQSGILSEQINPFTGEQVSAAPLTWSHAEFVYTVIYYLEKLDNLGICRTCYPVK